MFEVNYWVLLSPQLAYILVPINLPVSGGLNASDTRLRVHTFISCGTTAKIIHVSNHAPHGRVPQHQKHVRDINTRSISKEVQDWRCRCLPLFAKLPRIACSYKMAFFARFKHLSILTAKSASNYNNFGFVLVHATSLHSSARKCQFHNTAIREFVTWHLSVEDQYGLFRDQVVQGRPSLLQQADLIICVSGDKIDCGGKQCYCISIAMRRFVGSWPRFPLKYGLDASAIPAVYIWPFRPLRKWTLTTMMLIKLMRFDPLMCKPCI